MKRHRVRRAVLAAVFVAAVCAAQPVSAGQGAAAACSDGTWTDTTVLHTPVILAVETWTDPTVAWVTVCFSDTPLGVPSSVVGGYLKVQLFTNGTGFVQCRSDASAQFRLDCDSPFHVNATTAGLGVFVQAGALNIGVGQTGIDAGNVGVAPGPVVTISLHHPCVWVLGVQHVPTCGAVIV